MMLYREIMQRCIYNPFEHLRWSFLRKYVMALENTVTVSSIIKLLAGLQEETPVKVFS